MKIAFPRMTVEQVPLYLRWAKRPHVTDIWFMEGYEPPEAIYEKIDGNGFDEPYCIEIDGASIGYLVACDLDRYRATGRKMGLYEGMEPGSFSIDLFIGEESYLNRGIGTLVVREFCRQLFLRPEVKRIVLDPAVDNLRAIRCYEKVGFKTLFQRSDKIHLCQVMQLARGAELCLIVVRHAEAEHNVQKRFNSNPLFEGYTPSHLTERGRLAVQRTARGLLGAGFSYANVAAVHHSPLPRTVQTMEILRREGAAAREEVSSDMRLIEEQALEHEGRAVPSVERPAQWRGESLEEIYDRVSCWYDEVVAVPPSGHVMAVTHGTPALQLLKRVTGMEIDLGLGEAKVVPLLPLASKSF